MTRFELEVSERFLRRTFEKGVSRSICKILAELVTNADDSYKRLESAASDKSKLAIKVIRIIADRSRRKLSVVDQAEGLSESAMKDRFVSYGKESSDRSLGFQTRSLFGKGLRDVLFTQKFGAVKSIKDGRSAVAEFGWKARSGIERRPVIEINPGPKVNSEFRRGLGIPENGTRVELQLREDVPFPQHEVLCEKITNFYMLRPINSSPIRKIVVETRGKRGETGETSIHFSPIEGETLLSQNLEFAVEATAFPTTVTIRRTGSELSQGESGVEDRIGGLLVQDEDGNALDLTLFRFDKDPSASQLSGRVVIQGVGKYIRSKLNQSSPEEVLTETREGLDKKHPFYRGLAAAIEPLLEPIVLQEQKRRERPQGAFSKDTQTHLSNAMSILNKLYEELVGKADAGDEFKGKKPFIPKVLAFIRDELAVTEGVVTPLALLVNTGVVPDGTNVKLKSSCEDVSVTPGEIVVDHSEAKDGLLTRICHIKSDTVHASAILTAEAPQGRANASIRVIPERAFYPKDGLEFNPATLNLHDGKKRDLELFVDCTKVPVGSTIEFSVDNTAFALEESSVEVGEHHKLAEELACVRVSISGRGIGNHGTVIATSGGMSSSAFLRIVEKKPREQPPLRGTRFKEPVFEEISRKLQTTVRSDGTVVINMSDLVNKRYFGSDPYKSVNTKLHCQIRVAELVLDECLNEIVSAAWGRTLTQRFPDDPATDIRMYVAQKKFEIGPGFHDAFVTLRDEAS